MESFTSTEIDIRIEPRSAGLVVTRVAGEVDIVAAPTLHECVDAQFGGVRSLVLDLTETTFFGAAGLAVLVDLSDKARQHRVQWAVVGRHPVLRPLRATGLDQLLPVYSRVPDAITAVTQLVTA
ncbi:hypothetical protein BAY61_23100 [Prauserella marina]|uniref:Anti-sigma factor antagonist n=1 Tax=Prauserella marina TaxID=530584 RepID=A0A222VUL5_9PSEU|nr:STAS domain-containing protein [Prauserella marina]ASR37411.1 hypothetical protein BAY61_23100 [Prauserella marina]PWV74712.1 anti-anti-sigma factor [Prauserella marina]SDD42667.1 anti-anti-sigma factor [Prauserella marina]